MFEGMDIDYLRSIIISVLYIAVILLVTGIMATLSKALVRQLLRKTMPLVTTKAQRIVSITIWVIGFIFILDYLGLNTNLFLLLLALIGLGVIVGMRGTLENVGAKYSTDVYIPYKVGDTIRIGPYSGKVIEINPIATIVLAENNDIVSLPNSFFIREAMVNTTPQAWKEIIIPITIDNRVSVSEFESRIMKACNKLKMYFDEHIPPALAIRSRTESSTELTLTVMVKEVDKKDAIIAEINRRVKDILERMERK